MSEPVKCTMAVAKKCIYGCSSGANKNDPRCFYVLIEHHMRECPGKACTEFQLATKSNPKRKIPDGYDNHIERRGSKY